VKSCQISELTTLGNEKTIIAFDHEMRVESCVITSLVGIAASSARIYPFSLASTKHTKKTKHPNAAPRSELGIR
jgi:hypothetical protein